MQPSSAARYSLLGTPYSSKAFDYVTSLGNEFQDSENYAIKLNSARKNYITNWAYSPYFFSKSASWFNFNKTFFNNSLSINNTKFFFKEVTNY